MITSNGEANMISPPAKATQEDAISPISANITYIDKIKKITPKNPDILARILFSTLIFITIDITTKSQRAKALSVFRKKLTFYPS